MGGMGTLAPIGGMGGMPGMAGMGGMPGMGGMAGMSPLGNSNLPHSPTFTALDTTTGLPQEVSLNYPYPYPYMHPYAFLKKKDYPYVLSMDGV